MRGGERQAEAVSEGDVLVGGRIVALDKAVDDVGRFPLGDPRRERLAELRGVGALTVGGGLVVLDDLTDVDAVGLGLAACLIGRKGVGCGVSWCCQLSCAP